MKGQHNTHVKKVKFHLFFKNPGRMVHFIHYHCTALISNVYTIKKSFFLVDMI